MNQVKILENYNLNQLEIDANQFLQTANSLGHTIVDIQVINRSWEMKSNAYNPKLLQSTDYPYSIMIHYIS